MGDKAALKREKAAKGEGRGPPWRWREEGRERETQRFGSYASIKPPRLGHANNNSEIETPDVQCINMIPHTLLVNHYQELVYIKAMCTNFLPALWRHESVRANRETTVCRRVFQS